MRRIHSIYTLLCVALAVFALQSCQQKSMTEPPDGYVLKPYSLFAIDAKGLVWSTNDGERFQQWTGGTQGVAVESIFTSGHRLLFRSLGGSVLHATEPDTAAGMNLNSNPSYKAMNLASFGPSAVISLFEFNDTPKAGAVNRVYVASATGAAWNDSNGAPNTVWFVDGATEGITTGTTSFAQLANKKVVAYDDVSRAIYVRDNFGTFTWVRKAGNGLPAAGVGKTYIVSKGNDIVVVMVNGDASNNGIWVSTNEGADFNKQPDIMRNGNIVADITGATGAFGKVLIASTNSNGIWRLGGQGIWEPTFGLKEGTKVHAITSKYNVFKSEQVREYIYAATSTGLYRSDDLGQNWIRLDVEINVTGLDPEFVAIQ